LHFAVGAHDEFGEKRRVANVVNDDLLELRRERIEQRSHQIVREGTWYRRTLERQRDRGCLERPDEDREVALAFEVLQNHDGVVRKEIDSKLVDLHLPHPGIVRGVRGHFLWPGVIVRT
jgi:hypothetical protein